MRRVVTGGDLSQREVRPEALLDRYLSLVEADLQSLGVLPQHGRERPCPACGHPGAPAFERLGFAYHACRDCASLFASPLPDPSALERYHREGRAERYWREQVLTATAAVRARYTRGPRMHWVTGTATARLGGGLTVCELGGPNPLDRELLMGSAAFGAYVSASLAEETPRGAPVADVVLAFEALERAPDLARALQRCRGLVRPAGLLFVSTLSGSGFEVRLLGARMRSLVPPVHLQLLSRPGWVAALDRAGFTLLEYSTPGALDVQAVADACRRDPNLRLPPIVDELVRHEDDDVLSAFQEVLQQAGLSAHVQLVAAADPAFRGE
jgi:hypothetical protein